MKLSEEWVQEAIERKVAGVELVLLEEAGNRRQRVVRLYVDHAEGVTHELCARVSSAMSAALDEIGYADGPYTLEVSSPGLDRPLTKPSHFEAYVGGRVNVKLERPVAGSKVWRGRLREVRSEEIVVVDGDREAALRFENIAKANLIYEFERETRDE
jgi:ribosome maturation factor RimP